MKCTLRSHSLRRFGCVGLAIALCLGPALLAPATPAQDKEKNKPDQKDEPKKPGMEQPETVFKLSGRFRQGVLLQRQETVRNLAFLSFPLPGAQPNDYQVSIDWGDDSGVTRGQLIESGLSYVVGGRHSYARTGRYVVGICVTGPDGRTAVVKSSIDVGDLFAGIHEDWTVATFATTPADTASEDFQATIDWGDGTTAASGQIVRDGANFRVVGNHLYALDGAYTVSVLVTYASGVRLAHKRVVRVVRPQGTARFDFAGIEPNEPCLNGELATFHVANLLATAHEFSAIIDWGDGTPLDFDATVVGSRGKFRVYGSHTYTGHGSFRISVTMMQSWH